MMKLCIVALLLGPAAAVRALRDVPLGECYDCEVTCFEDCALKFDREIITPDAKLIQTHNATNATSNRVHFGWRSAPPTPGKPDVNQQIELANQYATCLKQDKCHGHPVSMKSKNKVNSDACAKVSGKGMSLIEKQRRCSVSDPSCAQKCATKVADTKQEVVLAQKDFPLHPVKINVFAHGTINMDFCLKSCLAVTCGCADAAGYTDAASVKKQTKANDAAGEPVKDLPPADHYRHATLAECAKGVFGQKVNKGMYINYGGGWKEVCSDDFLSTTYGIDADVTGQKKRCQSPLREDVKFGCVWDNQSEMCVYGDQTIGKCFTKYHDDEKL